MMAEELLQPWRIPGPGVEAEDAKRSLKHSLRRKQKGWGWAFQRAGQ